MTDDRGFAICHLRPAIRLELTRPDIETIDEERVALEPPWITTLHNCDCHTFEQVVRQLMKAIGCSESEGWEIAWQVHNTGKAVIKVGTREECQRVATILREIGLVVTVSQS
jgi:ATP-dependent Clp protease adapter protein ClpS